ncbi:MAG TPA: LuxR family transcriptional regulator [Candidatus Aminicenantes bacterium]|nr:LuxR family transcriptional regulator [Candidatus Aminicenantes bacterium]HRY64832.1 LuxR family transcriptional regulator [Candidatus Aminicenantes bacterium]HRZ71745.1 LuxR family transcriptional regulator [Candidatus Aminicenantes bacterium]
MSDVLAKHNALMERIIRDYGALITSTVNKILGGGPGIDDIIAEVHFAVFTTLRRLGEGWAPPRAFVSTIVQNKVNDLVWQHYWDSDDLAALKKQQAEQICRKEGVMAQIHTLTQSEFKIFRLLGFGLSNQEIAETLFISPLTVRTHVKRIHAKCDIVGRAKLALAAYQTCHHEAPEGRGLDAGAASTDLDGFVRTDLAAQQAS